MKIFRKKGVIDNTEYKIDFEYNHNDEIVLICVNGKHLTHLDYDDLDFFEDFIRYCKFQIRNNIKEIKETKLTND